MKIRGKMGEIEEKGVGWEVLLNMYHGICEMYSLYMNKQTNKKEWIEIKKFHLLLSIQASLTSAF